MTQGWNRLKATSQEQDVIRPGRIDAAGRPPQPPDGEQ
jgi:hypothetical protein